MSAYICPRCHAPIVVGQLFCKQCGLGLDPKSIAAFQTQITPMPVAPVAVRRTRSVAPLFGAGVALLIVCGVISAGRRTPVAATIPTDPPATVALVAAAPTPIPPTAIVPPTVPVLPTRAPATAIPPTALPTVAPLPTETPLPTATLIPPTVPLPTETLEPTVDALDESYQAGAIRTSGEFLTLLDQFSTEMSAADLLSDTWKLRVVPIMFSIQAEADQVLALQPSSRFRSADIQYKAAARHYKTAMDLFAKGVDHSSASLIQQSKTELQLGNSAIQRASALITALTHAPTPPR